MTTGTIILLAAIAACVLAVLYVFVVRFTDLPDRILFHRLNGRSGIRTTGKVIGVIDAPWRYQMGSDKVGIPALIFMVEFKAVDGSTYRNKYRTTFTSCRWLGRHETGIHILYHARNPRTMTLDRTHYRSMIGSLKEAKRARERAFHDLEG
jgi:hypothetical protein